MPSILLSIKLSTIFNTYNMALTILTKKSNVTHLNFSYSYIMLMSSLIPKTRQ